MHIIIKAAMKRQDRQAWLAAQYNAVAYHNPQEMPDDPAIEEQPRHKEADIIYVREFMRSLAERTQDGS